VVHGERKKRGNTGITLVADWVPVRQSWRQRVLAVLNVRRPVAGHRSAWRGWWRPLSVCAAHQHRVALAKQERLVLVRNAVILNLKHAFSCQAGMLNCPMFPFAAKLTNQFYFAHEVQKTEWLKSFGWTTRCGV